MDPIQALHQIAFELERAGAPTFRVQAFRRAARVAAALPPAELDRRLSAGALQELPGIGPAAASAMTQAAAGMEPEYLTKLLAEGTPVQSTAMRAALRGDCHTRTQTGRSSLNVHARILGRNALAFCLYNGQRGTGLGTAADCFPVGALGRSDLPRPRL